MQALARFRLLLILGLMLAFSACDQAAPWSCRDCNVILISIDTLRADRVGSYGYSKDTTPVLDELAARSVLFERAISQSSWTRPAHMSIMTGLYPAEHGFVALADQRPLEDDVPTLASVFQAKGWQTAAFTGGVNVSASFGFDSGFDLYRTNGESFRDNLEDFRWWLDQEREDRFFLFLHGYDPHTPYDGFETDRKAMGLSEKRPRKSYRKTCNRDPNPRSLEPFFAEYDAAVHRADRYVGKMLEELRSRGLLENALLVVTSDHGEEFGEHGGCFHLNTLYSEVLDVPLLISGPGLKAARVSAAIPASVSIAPTIAEAVLGKDHGLPGFSLVSALSGETIADQAVWSETERSTEHQRGRGAVQALTHGGRKLLRFETLERSEFYDHARDPGEQAPLQGVSEDLVAALARKQEEYPSRFSARRAAGAAAAKAASGADDALNEQLRALGYAE